MLPREQFEMEMTFNSNAIEDNSLTLKETFLVVNDGLTIKENLSRITWRP